MKIIIEKELCEPTDGWTVPGPYYHVVRIDEKTGEREVLKTFDNDIKDAAKYAEYELDVTALAVAYAENPKSFEQSISVSNSTPLIEIEQYKGVVSSISENFATVRYEDCTGNTQLFYMKPDNLKRGDVVMILPYAPHVYEK